MRHITIFIFFIISLFADMGEIQKAYETKEYQKVLVLAKASTSLYNYPKLHLLWAKAAQKLGELDVAMSAYERVLILDENNIEARLALMQIYLQTKRQTFAKEQAKELQKYTLSSKQKELVRSVLLQTIQSVRTSVGFIVGYDTNINVAPKEIEGFNTTQNIATSFMQFNSAMNYINEFYDRGGVYYRLDTRFGYQKNFAPQTQKYDMATLGIQSGFGYRFSRLNLYLPFGASGLYYLEKPLFYELQVVPKLSYKVTKHLSLQASFRHARREYVESADRVRDERSMMATLDSYYFLGKNFLFAKISYGRYEPVNVLSAPFVERQYTTAMGGINIEMTSSLSGSCHYIYRLGEYSDQDRKDTYKGLSGRVGYRFTKHYELYTSLSYTDNSSNIPLSSYEKAVAMFGINLQY